MLDVDDRSTWPEWLDPWVRKRADSEYGRLIEEDEAFRARLAGTKLVAFHCTRLLDHELGWIRRDGLRPLTVELVEKRLHAACDEGYLDLAKRDMLLASHTFAANDARFRRDQVCLILGRGAFDEAYGCEPLLSTWGGEAIYRYSGNLESRLSALGVPSIVVTEIDLSVKDEVLIFPALGKLFLELAREPLSYHASVHHRAGVPAHAVLDIWQPGCPEYDCHRDLPR